MAKKATEVWFERFVERLEGPAKELVTFVEEPLTERILLLISYQLDSINHDINDIKRIVAEK